MCSVLGVSKSGYYDWFSRKESQRKQANRRLLVKIREIYHQKKARYGSPRIHAELIHRGIQVSKGRVERLMRSDGIVARRALRHRRTNSHRDTQFVVENHLDRQFSAMSPNEKWVCDITFIPTRQGWLYLAVVLDLYSRAIVGWSMSKRINGQLVLDALDMAVTQRRPKSDVLVHSDQGSLYGTELSRKVG